MQLIIVDSSEPARLAALVELADEMMEDPQCHVVIPGARESGAVVVSVWPDDVALEVEAGLIDRGWSVRRFQMLD